MASLALDISSLKKLTDDSLTFNKDDYYIKISADKENRTLTIADTGIGMTKEELEEHLGTIVPELLQIHFQRLLSAC